MERPFLGVQRSMKSGPNVIPNVGPDFMLLWTLSNGVPHSFSYSTPTGGAVFTASAFTDAFFTEFSITSVEPNLVETLQSIAEDLDLLFDIAPDSPLSDKLEDALVQVTLASFELNKDPADIQAAAGILVSAIAVNGHAGMWFPTWVIPAYTIGNSVRCLYSEKRPVSGYTEIWT